MSQPMTRSPVAPINSLRNAGVATVASETTGSKRNANCERTDGPVAWAMAFQTTKDRMPPEGRRTSRRRMPIEEEIAWLYTRGHDSIRLVRSDQPHGACRLFLFGPGGTWRGRRSPM